MTLMPGTYTSAAAVGLTGHLVLDASDANAVWTFTVGAAFTTAAGSTMIISGTHANTATVLWDVTDAITLGAGSFSKGIMDSDAAITVGASAECGIFKAGGALTVGANTEYASAVGVPVTFLGAGTTKSQTPGLGIHGVVQNSANYGQYYVV
jgi:hypothetical protein